MSCCPYSSSPRIARWSHSVLMVTCVAWVSPIIVLWFSDIDMLWHGLPARPHCRPKVSFLCPLCPNLWWLLKLETYGHTEWSGQGPLPQPTYVTQPGVPDGQQTSLVSDEGMIEEKKAGTHSAQTRAYAAVLVVVGIAVAGLLLVSLVVLLGHRERRIARAALPKQSQIDAFWYLRPKRSRKGISEEPADAGAEDSVAGDENPDE